MRVLSGIQPSGDFLHVGNYFGALRQQVALQEQHEVLLFIADYHSMTSVREGAKRRAYTRAVALDYLACGVDPARSILFRQSDVPETTELTWLLTCVTAKGLLNRAHAYKAAVDANVQANEDADAGVSAGLYMYPVLMAADILLFNAHRVPVGRDQKQHVEMARDIAQRFNHHFGVTFVLPEAMIGDNIATLPGLDGRKMSKSYGNVIPLFSSEKELRKLIMKIKTNSLEPGQPKDPADSALYEIYRAFATDDEVAAIRKRYAEGIGWGDMKQLVFERINTEIAPARAEYERLMANPREVEDVLREGAERARAVSRPFLAEIRDKVGVRPLAR